MGLLSLYGGIFARSYSVSKRTTMSVARGGSDSPKTLAHRNCSDFLRFAIAMPIADPRNRAISETRDRGRVGPATSAWSPPGNGSQLGCVFGRCADVLVVSVCKLTVTLFVRLVWSLSGCFFLEIRKSRRSAGPFVF